MLEPMEEALDTSGWQAQKSAATRKLILESAIRCFVELGYAGTTTTAIAQRAGLSRGAMLHHFPSKIDVFRGAIEYLHSKRLRAFRRAMARTPPEGADRVMLGVRAFWAHVRHPMFVAFFELSVAARTDPELAAILAPSQQAFEREWYQTAREVFPEWQGRDREFDIALDLSRNVLEGMAIRFLTEPDEERVERVLGYLAEKLRELKGG
jgi:AcrR family transcriptional regulator